MGVLPHKRTPSLLPFQYDRVAESVSLHFKDLPSWLWALVSLAKPQQNDCLGPSPVNEQVVRTTISWILNIQLNINIYRERERTYRTALLLPHELLLGGLLQEFNSSLGPEKSSAGNTWTLAKLRCIISSG